MGARRIGILIAWTLLWVGTAQAQAPGTPGGGSGSSGTGTSGSGTSTGGAPGAAGGVTFDPTAAAAARLFGTYRVPGAPPLDISGVYRVDTGSSPPPAGGGGGASSTGSTSAGSSSSSGSTTTAGTNTSSTVP